MSTEVPSSQHGSGPSPTTRVLARNTLWNYTGFAVNLAANLLLFPFVVHRIGDAAAGIWLLLGAVTGYMGLLELGIVPSLTQTVAAALGHRDEQKVNRAASTAMALLLGLGLIPLLIAGAAPALAGLLQVPAGLEAQATIVFRVAIVGFALRMPLAVFQALLLGTQRQDRCNQLWIGMISAKLIGTYVVLLAGLGLVSIVLLESVVHLLAGVLQVRWVAHELPTLRLSRTLVSRDEATHLAGFGGALFALTVCSLLIEQTDRLVIAAFLPVGMVTYYAAAWKLYMLAYAVPTTFLQAVAPLAADMFGRGNLEGLRTLFLRMTRYSAALALPIVITLATCGSLILRFWLGAEFGIAFLVLQILAITFAVSAYNHAGYSVLVGMRRVAPMVWSYTAPQAALNLILSLWLVGPLGIVGVAIGTMLPAVLLEGVFLRYVLSQLELSWREFANAVVWPTVVPVAVSFWPLAAVYWWKGPDSPVVALAAIACLAIYAWIWWSRGFSTAERQEIARLLAAARATRFRPPFLKKTPVASS